MTSPRYEALVRRLTERLHAGLATDLMRLREDAGMTRKALAEGAGVDLSYLCRIEDGRERPSLETYVRVAATLGLDLSAHLYPNTGPAIRDRHQAPVLEALLGLLHPRWQPFAEVAVRRPGRGWIDVVLHDRPGRLVVATEIQSELRRLEQIVRWSAEKASSLPSWEGWTHLGEEPEISRLMIVRRTRTTRATAVEFERQLRAAYPAHPDDALAALRGGSPWPGPALVWAVFERGGVRLAAAR